MIRSFRRGTYSIILLLLLFGCNKLTSNQSSKTITIKGQVVDKISDQPISNAIVRITNPPPEIDKITDSTGAFEFQLKIDTSETFNMEARKEGYDVFSTTILAIPDRNVNLPVIQLASTDTSTTNNTKPTGSSTSGYAAAIVLESVSNNSVVVKESGGDESSELKFQVQDSSGVPVDLNHSAQINFKFGASPDGGETLSPSQVTTDKNGEVTTTLTSGTKAGVVQVVAQAEVKGKTLYSKPVPISITAGLPDQAHFTFVASQYNIPFPLVGAKYAFTSYAGDKYGNVVTDGVSVYFTTDGGYIEGSSTTGTDGSATVNLIDGNPFPPNGIASITATTADENFNPVTATAKVIFSKEPIITISPKTFNIPDKGIQVFNYSVEDMYGHPMVKGNSITVTVDGENIKSKGDLSISMPDVNSDFSNMNELMNYSFTISDALPDSIVSGPVIITIESKGPNGDAKVKISGVSN